MGSLPSDTSSLLRAGDHTGRATAQDTEQRYKARLPSRVAHLEGTPHVVNRKERAAFRQPGIPPSSVGGSDAVRTVPSHCSPGLATCEQGGCAAAGVGGQSCSPSSLALQATSFQKALSSWVPLITAQGSLQCRSRDTVNLWVASGAGDQEERPSQGFFLFLRKKFQEQQDV